MNNLVSISKIKDNVLEFNVHVTGADDNNITVQFIIEGDEMDLTFNSERGDEENLWVVKVPALSILEITSYPFRIDVIIEGYRMEAMQGSINVVGSHDIYSTKPENITLSPSKKQTKPKAKVIKKKVDVKKKEHLSPAKKVTKLKVEEPEQPKQKPNRKFEMTPVKVEDGKELFDVLTKKAVNHVRKKDEGLDDKIIDLLTTTKVEKDTKPKKVKKVDEPKKTKKTGVKEMAADIIKAVTGIDADKEECEKIIVEKTKDDKLKEIIAEDKKVSRKRRAKKR